jgi:caffeoyl-CoA O-methyltransferase
MISFRQLFLLLILISACSLSFAQDILADKTSDTPLDQQVKAFLRSQKGKWRDLNVPASDGELLFKVITEKKYTRALEIGTSTGHSAIWIAWALSKTGGKLTTIEIQKSRYDEAVSNFKKAGLSAYIDARLGDAHTLVKELAGPFDFVFSDADKDWYINYFKDVAPKLTPGGCIAAHNVYSTGRGLSGTREYLQYVQSLNNFTTTVDDSGGGIAFSYKR